MEQELTFAIAPLVPILGAMAVGAVGSAVAGKGDRKAGKAAQAEALALERQRQEQLQGRFASQQPLREESLKQLLQMGSTENPFSRRLSDEKQAGILGKIQSLQTQAGQVDEATRSQNLLDEIQGNEFEISKFHASVADARRGGRDSGREAADVLRHFGYDISTADVARMIRDGSIDQVFQPGGAEALRRIGVGLNSSFATPTF